MTSTLRVKRVLEKDEMYCSDLEVMSSNPVQIELGVRGTSVYVTLEPKICYVFEIMNKLTLGI